MTFTAVQRETLDRLLAALLDDELTRRQAAELERIVLGDAEAMRHYVRVVNLNVGLRWMAEGERASLPSPLESAAFDDSAVELPNQLENLPSPFGSAAFDGSAVELPNQLESLPSPFGRGVGGEGGVPAVENLQPMFPTPHSVLRTPYSFLPTTPLGNVAFSYAMSALLVCIGLFIFSLMSASSPRDAIVKNPIDHGNQTTANISSPTPEPEIVSIGRITGMVDCVWVNPSEAPFHDKIKLHDKFALKSGLMEITYYTGARVILQGPCTYEVESSASGYLSLGKLTARVESRSRLPSGTLPADRDNAKSRPAGGTYFAIRTPTAVVTDLGTEFGVEVEESSETTSTVFAGKVELRRRISGRVASQAISLSANESARVSLDGDEVISVSHKPTEPNRFVRVLPRITILSQDNADSPAYSAQWQNGGWSGNGWNGGWNLENDGQQGLDYFIGSAAGNNTDRAVGRTSFTIDTNGRSFGLRAARGMAANAIRDFQFSGFPLGANLPIDATFSIDLDSGRTTRGSSMGFDLSNSAGQSRFKFFIGEGLDAYSIQDGLAKDHMLDRSSTLHEATSIPETDKGVRVELTRTGDETYRLRIVRLEDNRVFDIPNRRFSACRNGTDVSRFRAWNWNTGGNDEATLYFNNIRVYHVMRETPLISYP